MIKRLKKINNIGRFINASNTTLGKVSLIYGPNCFGKSTITDILRSLQQGNPKPIQMRLSIGQENNSPHAELTFSENQNTTETCLTFSNSWNGVSPQNIKIFDSKFIEQHIFTGLSITRENKENLTNLILGQSSVQTAQDIKNLKQDLAAVTKELNQLEDSLKKTLGQADLGLTLDAFLDLEKDIEIEKLKLRRQKVTNDINEHQRKINDKKLISQLNDLSELSVFQIDGISKLIDTTLQSSYDDINEASFKHIEEHMKKHENEDKVESYTNWIKKGTTEFLLPESEESSSTECPFCSQSLDSVDSLIKAYKAVFNTKLIEFESNVVAKISDIEEAILNAETDLENILKITLRNSVNSKKIETYTNKEQAQESVKAEDSIESLVSYTQAEFSVYKTKWNASKVEKLIKPFDKKDNLEIHSELRKAISDMNIRINSYNEEVKETNADLKDLKEVTLEESSKQIQNDYKKILTETETKIKRYELDSDVISIKNKRQERAKLETNVSKLQKDLEDKNKSFIEGYFNEVTEHFHDYGSRDFNIKTTYRKRGNQPIYEPTIEFLGEEITEDRLPYVFSEADRRALGFSIFQTEINRLSPEEKQKTIIVLDDPVTSFDTNRVSKTCQSILKFAREFDQVIILTHSGTFYLDIFEVLRKVSSELLTYEIIRKESTNDIGVLENPKARFDTHTKELENIEKFIQAKDPNQTGNIRRALRPFLQSELEWRYNKQIKNQSYNGLGELADFIYGHNLIKESIKDEIKDIAAILNTDHHEDENAFLEDTRNVAIQVLNLIYEKMNPRNG